MLFYQFVKDSKGVSGEASVKKAVKCKTDLKSVSSAHVMTLLLTIGDHFQVFLA